MAARVMEQLHFFAELWTPTPAPADVPKSPRPSDDELIRLYLVEGLTAKQLAARYDFPNLWAVYAVLKRRHVTRPDPKPADAARIKASEDRGTARALAVPTIVPRVLSQGVRFRCADRSDGGCGGLSRAPTCEWCGYVINPALAAPDAEP